MTSADERSTIVKPEHVTVGQSACAQTRNPHAVSERVGLLLAAADRGADDVCAAIDKIGPQETAKILINEIVFRSRLDELTASQDVSVIIALRHRGQEITTRVSASQHGVRVGQDAHSALPPTTVAQDMVEVTYALYGARETVSASTREIRWPSADFIVPRLGDTPLPVTFHAIVQRVIRALDRDESADLTRTGHPVRHG